MAKVCELCGRGPQFGNRISHAHNVTKRRWNINLQNVRAMVKGAAKWLAIAVWFDVSGRFIGAPIDWLCANVTWLSWLDGYVNIVMK